MLLVIFKQAPLLEGAHSNFTEALITKLIQVPISIRLMAKGRAKKQAVSRLMMRIKSIMENLPISSTIKQIS